MKRSPGTKAKSGTEFGFSRIMGPAGFGKPLAEKVKICTHVNDMLSPPMWHKCRIAAIVQQNALNAREMEVSMSLIVLGALLVLAGLVFLAVQIIRRAPLSSEKRRWSGAPPSLDPPRQGGILDLKGNWPGYLLIVAGGLLLLTGVAT